MTPPPTALHPPSSQAGPASSSSGSDAPESPVVLRDVEKAFGEHEVLKGFSLEVTEGEILCLLGGSGSGKSVTLKIVNGLLRPDAGEVWVCGREIGSGDAEALAEVRARLGMNFQSDALLKGLTVFENVALPLRETTDLEESEIAERVRARLELLGVAEAAEKLPEELSGGMRKRVGLARAVVRQDEVQLVLYDEPTAGLDPISKDSVHQMIDELRELELTQIVVTHDLETVRQLADRVGVLHEGKLAAVGPLEELVESEDAFVRKILNAEHDG